ncbi:MAG: hypothetical protein H3C56_04920, partial [Chitinophagaceae bacterium]|nr:hypothetical protein [Chitinophagaceae bacterium]
MNNRFKHKFLLCFLLGVSYVLQAQNFNNEWIDYGKTYYKFKIAANGLYRINQTALPTPLNNIPVEQLQLWRNGNQVPLFTSVATGILPVNGYIEFWGEKNDGVPDKPLYRVNTNQLSDKISLQTDTAVFFVNVKPVISQNLRYCFGTNNFSGNYLPA